MRQARNRFVRHTPLKLNILILTSSKVARIRRRWWKSVHICRWCEGHWGSEQCPCSSSTTTTSNGCLLISRQCSSWCGSSRITHWAFSSPHWSTIATTCTSKWSIAIAHCWRRLRWWVSGIVVVFYLKWGWWWKEGFWTFWPLKKTIERWRREGGFSGCWWILKALRRSNIWSFIG